MNLLYTITAYTPSTGGSQHLMHQLARTLITHHSLQVLTQWTTNRTDWLLGTTLKAPSENTDYQVDRVPVHQIGLSIREKIALVPWVAAYFPLQDLAIHGISRILENHITPYAAQADLIHNCRIGREGLSYASLNAARKFSIPFVLTPVHHPRWGGWFHRYYHQLYRQADAVIALTETERQILITLGVSEKNIFVTGMGPVLAEYGSENEFRQKYKFCDDPLVLFLGQKYAYKGLESILRAAPLVWKRFPKTRFVFIGPRTGYSQKLFAGMTDPRILELGTVTLQEKTDALAACSLLCVPSSQESFGGVYTEAWMLERPVIGCAIPSVSEVIADGQDGLLTDQSPESVAAKIIALLTDPQRATSMGQAGKQKVLNHFTWEQLARKTEQIYHTLTKTNG